MRVKTEVMDSLIVSLSPWNEECRKRQLPYCIGYLPIWLNGEDFMKTMNPWSLSPAVARHYGLLINKRIDERNDIKKSTSAALSYVEDLVSHFYNYDIALFAYINGASLTTREITALVGNNDKEYADISDSTILLIAKKLPSWSKKFKGIVSLQELGKEVKWDSMTVSLYNQICISEIMITNNVRLTTLAEILASEEEELRQQNPHIRQSVQWLQKGDVVYIANTMETDTLSHIMEEAYALELAEYKRMEAEKEAQRLAMEEARKKAEAEAAKTKYHIVRQGDTLGAIARRNNVSVKELKQWNGLKSDMIRIGQKLKILPK